LSTKGLDATVFAHYSVSSEWGSKVEPGATLETAVTGGLAKVQELTRLLAQLLTARQEQACYMTLDGDTALLLFADGRFKRLVRRFGG
jgi:hypothetical protein